MYKIVLIFTALLFFSGCAASKRLSKNESDKKFRSEKSVLLNEILEKNLTGNSFFIEKGKYTLRSGDFIQEGSISIKFNYPDKYLISIRAIAGIEILRIFMNKDSIYVNSRLDKKLLLGSVSYLERKFGISYKMIPIIFGDFVQDNSEKEKIVECISGLGSISYFDSGSSIKFDFDCERKKVSRTSVIYRGKNKNIRAEFNDFNNVDVSGYPEEIRIIDEGSNDAVILNIEKIITNWQGKIEFIPGKQYDRVPLI